MQWSIALPVAREHEFLFCLFWLDLSYFAYIELALYLFGRIQTSQTGGQSFRNTMVSDLSSYIG